MGKKYLMWFVVIILISGCGVLGYFYYKTNAELLFTKTALQNTKLDLAQSEEKAKILAENLATEQYKNSLFSGQINAIVGTVGTLDKLAKTDKELLQKYSKVYFLNENYLPDALTELPLEYIYDKNKQMQIHAKAFPFFESLFKAAKNNGVDLEIISAFRSFGTQSSLKQNYTFTYGSGANQFSADQGYSEHQLGTTLDFTTLELGTNFTAFAKTDAYKWMQSNAYKHGFVISYPEGNTYYQFEPWHWRFVGRKLAERLHEENQNFYDMSQNQIDTYLINLFD